MDEIADLLKGIRYELQIANWQRAGGKGDKPVPPGMQAVTIKGERVLVKADGLKSFSGKVVRVVPEGVNDAISRSIRDAKDYLDGQASA